MSGPGTASRTRWTTPDCRAGRARASPPSRPSISGFPGRMAMRQKPRPCPAAVSADCTRSCSPTEAPPSVTRMSAPRVARGLDAALQRRERVARDAEIDRLAAGLLDQRGEGEPVGGDDLVGAAARSPGRTSSSPVARMATRGLRRTLSPAWPTAAASARRRAVEALARLQKRVARREVEPGRADMAVLARPARVTSTLVARRARRSPGSRWRRRPRERARR